MRREKILTIVLTLAFSPAAYAQNIGYILEFTGAGAVEEMNPYDVERLEEFIGHPLQLNIVSESRLSESGLLSRYQVTSLEDYRSRHGDVMSLTELAAVDGFSHDFVSKLAPFISLETNRPAGFSAAPHMRNDISVRTSLRGSAPLTYSLKYKLSAGERFTGGLSVSRTSEGPAAAPDAYSGHIAYHYRSHPGKIILGDFNARFGQGLTLWNGMSFSGLTSASSFMKRSAGISSSSSFTGSYSLRGMASELGLGPIRLSALAAVSKAGGNFIVMPAFNVSWLFRNGQASMTHYADFSLAGRETRIPDMKTAADMAFCLDGTDIFAEASFDWVSSAIAALAGAVVPAGEDVLLSAMLRCYPPGYSSTRSAAARSTTKCTNEYAVSMAGDFNMGGWIETVSGPGVRRLAGKVSADFAYFPEPKAGNAGGKSLQIKAQTEWKWMISSLFGASVRISERVRTWGEPFRTDLRTDLTFISEHIHLNLRLNALRCVGTGLLGYLEGGYRNRGFAAYLRSGVFRIDDWEDRIYAYERDAPGSFNVPAYYGRGVWGAFTMNWKFTRWGRMYVRTAVTSYPFMDEKKPGRAELKVQFVFRL